MKTDHDFIQSHCRSGFNPTSFIKHSRGFTLVEVMVALAIVAIALPALMVAIGQQLDGTAYIRDKTTALWVAQNQMAEIRLKNRIDGKLPDLKKNGSEEIAGRNWYWTLKTKRFPQPEFKDMAGVEITVRQKDDENKPALITFYGFLQEFSPAPIVPGSLGGGGGGGGSGVGSNGRSGGAATGTQGNQGDPVEQ